eukprot:TRINITY_DN2260_c0_g1_i1.p1 TRINITY_DN2260_c0_g1~~TRINITY_DN2260_c0_g1_i1.p1  ORF type:complete len:304 (-),score=85.70 TRINITY_DN2260_c0_g1_i1:811-1722(-)
MNNNIVNVEFFEPVSCDKHSNIQPPHLSSEDIYTDETLSNISESDIIFTDPFFDGPSIFETPLYLNLKKRLDETQVDGHSFEEVQTEITLQQRLLFCDWMFGLHTKLHCDIIVFVHAVSLFDRLCTFINLESVNSLLVCCTCFRISLKLHCQEMGEQTKFFYESCNKMFSYSLLNDTECSICEHLNWDLFSVLPNDFLSFYSQDKLDRNSQKMFDYMIVLSKLHPVSSCSDAELLCYCCLKYSLQSEIFLDEEDNLGRFDDDDVHEMFEAIQEIHHDLVNSEETESCVYLRDYASEMFCYFCE